MFRVFHLFPCPLLIFTKTLSRLETSVGELPGQSQHGVLPQAASQDDPLAMATYQLQVRLSGQHPKSGAQLNGHTDKP